MALLRTLEFITNHPLNKDHKAAAILRFVRWQIGSRILQTPIVYEWMPGAKVVIRRGDTGMTQNLYCGLHDFHDMAYLLHMITPEDVFIDIGANVGSYTVLACGVKRARGYCFEPIPSTYTRLLDNIFINNLQSKVTSMNLGLADEDGELHFTSRGDTVNHILAESESTADAVSVPVRTLDSILSEESPSMIKIDVEGYETKVLAGAKQTLSKPSLHSIIMELNGSGERYGFDEGKILETMRGYGFMTFDYDPIKRRLHALDGKNNNHGNTLFIRNMDFVQEKLAQAPRMKICQTVF